MGEDVLMCEGEYAFRAIGVVHSPHDDPRDTPIQPAYARGIKGTVVLWPEYSEGLQDLDGFSHVYLFYYFHRSRQTKLVLKPYLEDRKRGVFATRAPHRPNKLGMSLVRLTAIEGNVLHIEDVDILNGTPLFDIKPYIERFELRDRVESGWQEGVPDDVAQERGRRPGTE